MMSTALAERKNGTAPPATAKVSPLVVMAQRFNLEPDKMLTTLKGTVIKPTKDGYCATNEEIAAFVIVANEYGLNPFLREIYAFADPRKGVTTIVPIDGWTRIVNRQQTFDGCEFADVCDQNGKLVAITCRMHVKGRTFPVEVTEYISECQRPTDPWRQMPRRMLRHKAFMQAARLAFSLSGIHDEDEGRDIVETDSASEITQEVLSRSRSLGERLKSQSLPPQPTPTADVPPEEPEPPIDEEPPAEDCAEPPPADAGEESQEALPPPEITKLADLGNAAEGEVRRVACTVKRLGVKELVVFAGPVVKSIKLGDCVIPDWVKANVEVDIQCRRSGEDYVLLSVEQPAF